jgi:hypothetical protein
MAGVAAANAAASAGSIQEALQDRRMDGVIENLFRNTEVMGEFGTPRPMLAGSTYKVDNHYAGNTSVGTYQEGDSFGTAGAQSYLTALWPVAYYKALIQITGHAQDQLSIPGGVHFDQLGMEFSRGMTDVVNKVNVDMLGTGTTAPIGIQGIIDDSGTVAGISRVTYTWWKAFEDSSPTSTTIVVADLNTAIATTADATYEAQIDEIWTSWTQAGKLKTVLGNMGIAGNPYQNAGSGAAPLNMGSPLQLPSMGNIQIKAKRDLTSTIYLGLTKPTFFTTVMRNFTVNQQGRTDDSTKYDITCAFGLCCTAPRKNFKLSGLTDA